MAKHYESYNASYPLAYYEIGTIYAFYGSNIANAKPATSDQIQRFSAILSELEETENANAIKPVKHVGNTSSGRAGLQRYYAVVVSKQKNSIEAMFCNSNDGWTNYLTKRYIVSSSCSTDGKDLMPVQTKSSYDKTGNSQTKVGGITKAGKTSATMKVGGVTRVGTQDASSAGVGRITRANNNSKTANGSIGSQSMQTGTKVGGITRVNKVGGITRANKVGGITRAKT